MNELSRHPLPGNLRDLFRVAYRTIAARARSAVCLCRVADASDYGLAGVMRSRTDAGRTLYRSRWRAFAESSSPDALIPPGETIETKVVERALWGYLADELRRIAESEAFA